MHRLFQIQRPGKGIPQASLHKDADMPRMPTTGFWRVPVGTRMVEWLAVAASEGQPKSTDTENDTAPYQLAPTSANQLPSTSHENQRLRFKTAAQGRRKIS